jgi:hypothetical protein
MQGVCILWVEPDCSFKFSSDQSQVSPLNPTTISILASRLNQSQNRKPSNHAIVDDFIEKIEESSTHETPWFHRQM